MDYLSRIQEVAIPGVQILATRSHLAERDLLRMAHPRWGLILEPQNKKTARRFLCSPDEAEDQATRKTKKPQALARCGSPGSKIDYL
jgi:hypothetical protein